MQNLTAGLGQNLVALRTKAGLKQRELAALVTAAGHKMALSTVSRIETGDRVMSVADLLAFSKALRVPPVLLLVPAWRDAEVEIGGEKVDSWRAAQWVSGHQPLADDETFDLPAAVIALNMQHDDLVRRYEEALGEQWYVSEAEPFLDLKTASEALNDPPRPPVEVQRKIRVLLRDLREIRARMRQHGFPLPDVLHLLGPHVDDPTSHYHRTDTELATAILVDKQTGRTVDFREQSS